VGVIHGCCAGLWALAAHLSTAGAAHAAELSISAPTACSIGEELTFRVERALGQPLESAAPVRCTIHIARSSGMYGARMEVESIGSGRPSRLRSFSGPTCAKLTETLALAVVLAIGAGDDAAPSPGDPAADEGAAGAPDTNNAAQAVAAPASNELESATLEADAAPPASSSAKDAPRGPRPGVNAALVADAGTLPGLGLGAALGVSLGWDRFELRGLGTYLPAREASIETSGAAAGAEISLVAGSLGACLPRLLGAAGIELGACAGAELGWLAGTGTGLDISRSRGVLWTALRGDVAARWALGAGVGLDLSISALVPIERDEFSITGAGRVHRPGAVVGRASLGLSLDLGASR
jgi:hypothetical protein